MNKYKCDGCMQAVELVEIEHPITGESDEKVLWLMCECKGYRLGKPEEINYHKCWKSVKQH